VRAARRHQKPALADRSRIGGVTKSFTATVVLQLVSEKKLALADTVKRWLPGVIANGDVTTRWQPVEYPTRESSAPAGVSGF
jgi:CubicO group peptidase (beta-lactamase class C family)